jgi:hypothetical protein
MMRRRIARLARFLGDWREAAGRYRSVATGLAVVVFGLEDWQRRAPR